MPRPNPTAWVDETGIGDGTPITAARMENIENAIAALGAVPLLVTGAYTVQVGQTLYRESIRIASGGQIISQAGGTLVKV